ncbi:mechanosensitive ion channel, partial [Candidatus Bathyarchaeota archaeon]|nr:mechanosensitive ion channel [Candidatus Bathyarchaeota archaeon]
MVNLAEIIQGIIQTNQITSEVIASLITFSVVALIGWLAYYIFGRYILARAKKTKTTVDDYILDTLKKITLFVILLVGSYYTLTSLTFLQVYQVQLSQVFTVIGILIGAFMATRISNSIANWFIMRKSKENTNAKNNHILFILKKIIQLFVYIIAFLIILWVLGIDLSSVVVGLGVGGIAIAFALQSTLSDVFSA